MKDYLPYTPGSHGAQVRLISLGILERSWKSQGYWILRQEAPVLCRDVNKVHCSFFFLYLIFFTNNTAFKSLGAHPHHCSVLAPKI